MPQAKSTCPHLQARRIIWQYVLHGNFLAPIWAHVRSGNQGRPHGKMLLQNNSLAPHVLRGHPTGAHALDLHLEGPCDNIMMINFTATTPSPCCVATPNGPMSFTASRLPFRRSKVSPYRPTCATWKTRDAKRQHTLQPHCPCVGCFQAKPHILVLPEHGPICVGPCCFIATAMPHMCSNVWLMRQLRAEIGRRSPHVAPQLSASCLNDSKKPAN